MPTWIALAGNAAFIIARALVPIFGVVLLGWSPPKLLIVYFADTAATYYGFLAALALASAPTADASPSTLAEGARQGLRTTLRAVFVPIPTLLLVGFFFGILPLFVMLQIQDVGWSDLLTDVALWRSVGLQFAIALGLVLQRSLGARVAKGDPAVRLAGACLTVRWLVMILIGFFLARGIPHVVYGPVLIAAYALMTAALELAPEQVVAWARRVTS
jgi:hypothetical protein